MKILFDEKLFGFIRVQVLELENKTQYLFIHDGKNKKKFENVHSEIIPASAGTNRYLKDFLKKSLEITHRKTGEPLSELQKDISFKRTREFILSNK